MKRFEGIRASEGTALAPALFVSSSLAVPVDFISTPGTTATFDSEKERFAQACHQVQELLQDIQTRVRRRLQQKEVEIFEAQRLFLDDPEFLATFETNLAHCIHAETALFQTIESTRQQFQALPDEVMRGRFSDLLDVWQHVLTSLQFGDCPSTLVTGEDFILVAEEILPSMLGLLPLDHCRGMLSVEGSQSSHVSILARALNVPYLFGLHGLLEELEEGMLLGVDANHSLLWLEPDKSTELQLRRLEAQQKTLQEVISFPESRELETACDTSIILEANASLVEEVQWGKHNGARGIGLFRTEFLFTQHHNWPCEYEQFALYHKVIQAMTPLPVTFRVFDLGGDKKPAYLSLPEEQNPQLGRRGVRLFLEFRSHAIQQLRALLRAGAGCHLRLMAPMVTTLDEFREFAALVHEVQEQLRNIGLAAPARLELGVMLETPAALFSIRQWATEVDFFSVGTNDLVQFLMAADRNLSALRSYQSMLQPPVLQALAWLGEQAQHIDSPISICGESASDLRVLPLLLGMGFRRFSMAPSRMLAARRSLEQWTLEDAQTLTRKVLQCKTQEEVLKAL